MLCKDEKRKSTWCAACSVVCLFGGLICIGGALVFGLYVMQTFVPAFERQKISQMATLLPGHLTYQQWKDPQVDLYKDFYFFNLTNKEGFQNGDTPIVTEVGPYRYREIRIKFPLDPTGENGTFGGNTRLPYTQRKTYHFDRGGTPPHLNENDTVFTLNFPLVSAVAIVESESNAIERLANREELKFLFFLEGSKLWMQARVHDIIWNYTDPLMQAIHEAKPTLLPVPFIQIQVNNSAEDNKTSIVRTGTENLNYLCEFEQWDGNRTLSIWSGNATKLRGTEGLFFHPLLNPGENLYAFVDDVKRSFKLNYTEDTSVLGIDTYRYLVDYDEFVSAKQYHPNADYGSWGPTGTIFIGPIQTPVVPVFGSKPHFLDGDPSLVKDVTGMKPNRLKHDTIVDVEPITGANLNVARQLQMNFQVNRSEHYSQLKNVKGTNDTLYYPLFYVNEHGTMGEGLKSTLMSAALGPLEAITDVGWVITGVLGFLGMVFVAGGLLCLASTLRRFSHWRYRRSWRRELSRRDTYGSIQEDNPLLTAHGTLELSVSKEYS